MAGVLGGAKMLAKLKELEKRLGQNKTLRVGFLENAKYPTGQSVAEVAAFNNYGTTKAPPRPFFSDTVKEKSPAWPKKLGRIMKNNNGDVEKSLGQMGDGIKKQVQDAIVAFDDPPDSEETLARKKSANGAAATLVDTGHMLNSVDWDIQK